MEHVDFPNYTVVKWKNIKFDLEIGWNIKQTHKCLNTLSLYPMGYFFPQPGIPFD